MEYLTIDKDKIKKYNVNYDKETIIKFKEKVIDNCCEVEHGIFEDTYYPFSTKSEDFEYRNLISLGGRNDKNNINYIYKYEYDKYIYPYLVKLINRLLANDKSAIEEIFTYKGLYNFYLVDIDNKINELTNSLSDEEISIEDKINKTDELKDLLLKKKTLLLNDKSKDYYEELQQLISFELVDEIEFNDYQRLEHFLGIDYKFNDNVYRYVK